MQINQIDILVHPDYFQMDVSYLPFHERQMILRNQWKQRVSELEKQQSAILLHFSNMTTNSIEQGLKDISTIKNRVERDEIERIKKSIVKLGSRFIWFGWFVIPSAELLKEIFKYREFTYIPGKTNIRGYGEIFEVCMSAWVYKTALSLGIPSSNVEYCREESLTNADCNVINKWRTNQLINRYNSGFASY